MALLFIPGQPVAAAVAWSFGLILATPLTLAVMSSAGGVAPGRFLRLTAPPLAIALAMAVVVAAVGWWLRDLSPLLRLVVLVPVGVLVYAALLRLVTGPRSTP